MSALVVAVASGAAVSNLSAFITQDAGTTALSTGAGYSSATPAPSKVSVVYQALANTLASTTFKLYGASHNSTLNINAAGGGGTAYYGGTANSFILVEEIMA